MADKPVVHIGENSPEQVAFKLLELVSKQEHKSMNGYSDDQLSKDWTNADRKWILDTFAECLLAARGYRSI